MNGHGSVYDDEKSGPRPPVSPSHARMASETDEIAMKLAASKEKQRLILERLERDVSIPRRGRLNDF